MPPRPEEVATTETALTPRMAMHEVLSRYDRIIVIGMFFSIVLA
jgi:hypothetical protein